MIERLFRPQLLKRGSPSWIKQGRSIKTEHFTIRLIPVSSGGGNFGLIVKKKVGSSVIRNRIKRKLRHAFWRLDVSQGSLGEVDFIVIVKSADIQKIPFQNLLDCLKEPIMRQFGV